MSGIIQEMNRVVMSVLGNEMQASEVVYALIKNFGGERIYLPSNDYGKRNSEIIELFKAGASVDQLARRYRLSVKTVYRIIS